MQIPPEIIILYALKQGGLSSGQTTIYKQTCPVLETRQVHL